MKQVKPVFYTYIYQRISGLSLRWLFLICLCTIMHSVLKAQTFQVAGGIPYFPAYTNTASVTLSPIPTGAVIYDKSKSQLQLYTGSAWVSLCSANIPSTSNVSASFRIVNGIPVLSVTSMSTTATAGATYLNTAGSIYVGDGSAWNTLGNYMNKTNVTATNPARMGAVAGTGSALVIPVLSTAPTVTAAGAAYFDAVTANLKVYSGTAWLTVGCNLPYAINVTGASGSIYSGGSFTGNYTYKQDDPLPEGSSIYRWYTATNGSGSGKTLVATSKSYTIPSAIVGKYIAFGVIPVTNTGLTGTEALSTWNLVQWKCGDVLTKTHYAGSVAPTTVTINYGTVSVGGVCWITQNLGATRQATGEYDTSTAAAGWYWQFGSARGFDGSGSQTGWISSPTSSYWSVDPCNSLLGDTWHIPSQNEWANLLSTLYLSTWNSDGFWKSALKVHRGAGTMTWSNKVEWRDTGRFWSSSNENTEWAWRLYWATNYIDNTDDEKKFYGLTLRCRK